VLDANGNGAMSGVVKAFDWLLRNARSYGISVVSISWGAPQSTTYHRSLLSALVEAAWFDNITVVAAAGNGGAVTAPATDPFVIAVGSYNDMGTVSTADDTLSTFSAQGPTLEGFAKPDTLAPGEHVLSLRVSGLTYLDAAGLPVGLPTDRYIHMSGTSASAAYVAGVAALIKAYRATARPNDVKGAITASGRAVLGATTTAVDANSALGSTATANAGLLPSRLLLKILANAHQLTLRGVSWDGVSWDAVVWGGVSWEVVSWETVSWETVAWDTVAWETVAWEAVAWQDAVITE
jgi:serine protease AprX